MPFSSAKAPKFSSARLRAMLARCMAVWSAARAKVATPHVLWKAVWWSTGSTRPTPYFRRVVSRGLREDMVEL